MNKTIENLIQEFNYFDTWQDRYIFIIDLGRKVPFLSKHFKLVDNIVYGCVNKVWIHYHTTQGKFYFHADSNGCIIKGLLYIVLLISNGKTQREIRNINYQEIFNRLYLLKNLTPNRGKGLSAIINRIKYIADI